MAVVKNATGVDTVNLLSQIAALERDRAALQAQVDALSSRSATVSLPSIASSPTAALSAVTASQV